jgi:hypothetical protein
MPKALTSSDRSALIRLASTMVVGSPERKAILAGMAKSAKAPVPEVGHWVRTHYHGRALGNPWEIWKKVTEVLEESSAQMVLAVNNDVNVRISRGDSYQVSDKSWDPNMDESKSHRTHTWKYLLVVREAGILAVCEGPPRPPGEPVKATEDIVLTRGVDPLGLWPLEPLHSR